MLKPLVSRRIVLAGLTAAPVLAARGMLARAEEVPSTETHPVPLTITEQMQHSTVQIVSELGSNNLSSGSGFFFSLFMQGNQNVPVIITNKHVAVGDVGHISITAQRADGTPDLDNVLRVTIANFAAQWLQHPNPDVDLAILAFQPIVSNLGKEGKKPFFVTLPPDIVPTDQELSELTPLEDIIVVGYPNGISDTAHNIPVFRRGITATPAYIDFQNKQEFLIDASIFPGSSGSPVFLYNQGTYSNRSGGTMIGTRAKLLGVVHAVLLDNVNGDIKIIPAPKQARNIFTSQIPNNLGMCIRASRILEFEPLIVQQGFKVPDGYKMRFQTVPAK